MHLRGQCNIHLLIKGRVRVIAVKSVLLYGFETWHLKTEDTGPLPSHYR